MTAPAEPEHKTAIICMGGGMRSAYSAGFLYALGTKLKLKPDIIIGTSGSAGNVLYFASGQYDSARRVWCNLIATRRFISYWHPWRILNVDYLVDSIFKIQEPLDVQALADSKIEWLIPITDADSGKTRYISAHDKVDPFELLRAAKAIPLFYRKRIPLLGHRYLDGEVGPTLEDHAQFALGKGATRILIINDGRERKGVVRFIKDMLAACEPSGLRTAMLRDFSTDESVCVVGPKGTRIVCVFPDQLPVGLISISKLALSKTFNSGMNKAIALEAELRTLLS